MPSPQLDITQPDGETLRIVLTGWWSHRHAPPPLSAVADRIQALGLRRIQFDSRQLAGWDTSLAVFVSRVMARGDAVGLAVDLGGLPEGLQGLLALSGAAPRTADAGRETATAPLLARIGDGALRSAGIVADTLAFVGGLALSFANLLRGRAQFRRADLMAAVEDCGWKALPIVSLISVLVGLILSFMGAVQLKMFGAQIYVADLVSIGMAREMGAVMTAVIMAGRTGAAFAASIGTMQVNEEVDALETLGVSAMDYLVMPRTIALVIMMPLLTVYADVMGLLGGMVVCVGAFDISMIQFWTQTKGALTLTHLNVGLVKSVFFGVIVAVCGCMQGMRCGRNAAAVGHATTSAVVIAIVYIVLADGIFAVLTNELGI